MKVRNGFVSNSSSSSFVIAIKLDAEEYDEIYNAATKLLKEEVFTEGPLALGKDTVVYQFMNVEDNDMFSSESDYKFWARKNKWEPEDYENDYIFKLLKDGWKVITGSMPGGGDGGTAIQNFLREQKIDVEKDSVIMKMPTY